MAGQSRFVASKRTALDGRTWWCIFDQKLRKYLEGYKFRLRRECERHIEFDVTFRGKEWPSDMPFEPDN